MESISLAVSLLALALSALTAWLTLLRRGSLKMTQPAVIFFGPDGNLHSPEGSSPKIFLRSLLFSTSKRGRIIESMFAVLKRNETQQTFNIWVYGSKDLQRGSGLFVGEDGIPANHHFLMPKDGSTFGFVEGDYDLRIFAKILGDRKAQLMFEQKLQIDRNSAKAMQDNSAGIYFDWSSDSQSYVAHVEERPPLANPAEFLESLMHAGSDTADIS